ncbi:MAG: 30S ribosomal protein S17e [Methanotrichaceae archaeon]|nr:30S ribosomal protein S17e [Methanotrichaceae archaeon]
MGCVKPSYIKNFASELLDTYHDSFGSDFDQNKLMVSEYTDIKNKTIRNRIAGYITRKIRQKATRRTGVEIDV